MLNTIFPIGLELRQSKALVSSVEDIAKQYLYYLAYKDFLDKHSITRVKNYFLMPKETGNITEVGHVELDIWNGFTKGLLEGPMLC